MAIFNFWGNETDRDTVSTGSGVVFINNTKRGKQLIRAWAEAHAWPGNAEVPDDQVLDTIINEGGWLHRAAFGWLPDSYLRHMPAFYRGVSPVIDHDRGNAAGALGHSFKRPELPPSFCNETLAAAVDAQTARALGQTLGGERVCDVWDALALEAIKKKEGTDKEEDPEENTLCVINPKSALKKQLSETWCVSNCLTLASNDWPCPAEHCQCKPKPDRIPTPVKLAANCPNVTQGMCLGKFGATHPFQCLDGFAKNDCSSSLWMYPEYCQQACNEFATPDDPNATATSSRTVAPIVKSATMANNLAAQKGTPSCGWSLPRGCSSHKPYECTGGRLQGQCAAKTFDSLGDCTASCLHVEGFPIAPTSEYWITSPRKLPGAGMAHLKNAFIRRRKSRRQNSTWQVYPHYVHDDNMLSEGALESLSMTMGEACNASRKEKLIAVSMYSSKYHEKALRFLASCDLVGVCCTAAKLASDFFGPQSPEGKASFRYKFISFKPIFMWHMLKTLDTPIAWLDVDMEFHRPPKLFYPGSWPAGIPRDLAIFNFKSNDTGTTAAATASGVVYINNTIPGKAMLQAWAEASAWPGNAEAPDDQVLDKLLNDGGWLHRASIGWLPGAYLRHLPLYYRGVDPVIDHDRGNNAGILGHSFAEPQLPPTRCSFDESSIEAAESALGSNEEAITDALCDMWSGFTDGSLQKYSDTQHGADGSQTTGSATANEARRFLYRRTCRAKSGSKVYSTDWWCDENCNEGNCPFDQCYCEE